MRNHRVIRTALAAAILFLFTAGVVKAASRYEVVDRLEDFRKFFIDFQYAPDNAIPGDLLAECYGVIIIREYKAGFVVGVKGGDGVIMMHDRRTGEWSPPAFLISAEGSFGFQIGGQAIDGIILIMNQAGVDMLLKTRFKIGVDASAAAGPVGRDVSAKVGPGTALLTYSRSKGLFAGASFEGGALLNNDKYNRALYGRDVGLREILIDRMAPMPPEALNMVRTLKSYAVRSTAGGVAAPLPPPAAGDPQYQYQPNDQYQYQQDTYQYQQPDLYQYQQQAPYQDQGTYQQPGAYQQDPGYPGAQSFTPAYSTAPVIPPAPQPRGQTQNQAALDAAASQAARDAQVAAEAARNAAMAAEEAAARAAASRGGY